MSHLLIEKSFQYNTLPQEKLLFTNYSYDETKGYWLNKLSGLPLMHEDNYFKPRTKKCDVESGEDRKGE